MAASHVINTKSCRVCNIDKVLDEFWKYVKNPDGYNHACKACCQSKRRNREIIVPNTQKCRTCREELPANAFGAKSYAATGLHATCKNCTKAGGMQSIKPYTANNEKWCITCRIVFPLTQFWRSQNTCKTCATLRHTKNRPHVIVQRKICIDCKVELDADMFRKDNNKKDGISSYCKPCFIIRGQEYRASLHGCFSSLLHQSKDRSIHRSKTFGGSRIEAAKHTLTQNDMIAMYEEQEGLCFLSSIRMSIANKSCWQMSIERTNNFLGYHKTNCILVCYELNGSTQMTPMKLDAMPNLIEMQHNPTASQLFWKHRDTHIDKDHPEWTDSNKTIMGYIDNLIRSTRRNHESLKYNGEYTYTKEAFVKQYYLQGGRCYISGIPLTLKANSDWKLSPERVNPNLTYQPDNVVLICHEFNIGRSGQWTRGKFNYFMRHRHPTFWEQAIERHKSFLSQVEVDNEGITGVDVESHMGQNDTPLVSSVQYPWTRIEDKGWMSSNILNVKLDVA